MTPTLAIALATAGAALTTRPWCEARAHIVEHIGLHEGWWKLGSLPQRLNNPGAIKFVGQPGASQGPHGFAQWDSEVEGWSELERLVARKRKAGANFRRAWRYLKQRYE